MKHTSSFMPPAAVIAVFAVFLSFFSVDAGAAELVVPTGFASIQAAIDAAATGDTVIVEPGTYQEAITLRDGVTLRGRETARTLLSGGGGSGPIIVVSNPTAAAVRNFTFISASLGIRITDDTTKKLSITNNVFDLGSAANAVFVANSAQTEIVNNVFNGNGTAITRDSEISIVNNIFSGNVTPISSTATTTANISHNAFFGTSIPSDTLATPRGNPAFVQDVGLFVDPFFVNTALRDFHLKQGSALKNIGAPSVGLDFDGTAPDLGAYGGPEADPTPFPVQGLKITSAPGVNLIEIAWQFNDCYLIDNGGYRIYYGHAPGDYNGTESSNGTEPSPVTISSLEAEQNVGTDGLPIFTLADLPQPVDVLNAPVLFPPERRSGALSLSWSAVSEAAGYKVHYGQASTEENILNVGNTTSFTLTGLTNGQSYVMAVSSYVSSQSYYLNVTAFDSTPAQHESAFTQEQHIQLGQASESGLSNVITDFPDIIVTYPGLPNGSHACFIATAAYGSYTAPEVMALRAFRDRYLLSSAPGRMFVDWYYRNGPAAAALLNAHPAWKPAVRAALLPAVGMALFLTGAPAMVKACTALAAMSVIGLGFRRKRLSATGENR